jgi:hypothetical protein
MEGACELITHYAPLVSSVVASFLLEVLGGIGAIWGCTDVLGARAGWNNDSWRIVCGVAGLLFLLRWFFVCVLRTEIPHDAEVLALFVLQVLGGVGAWWGAAEIIGLRVGFPTDCHDNATYDGVGGAWAPGFDECRNTTRLWRVATACWLPWFVLWWAREDAIPRLPTLQGYTRTVRWARFAFLVVTTFVLDVMGGAGALWGAAEVAGQSGRSLRLGWGDEHFGQPSFDWWRPLCSATFGLCLVRWLLQLRQLQGAAGVEPSPWRAVHRPESDFSGRTAAAKWQWAVAKVASPDVMLAMRTSSIVRAASNLSMRRASIVEALSERRTSMVQALSRRSSDLSEALLPSTQQQEA